MRINRIEERLPRCHLPPRSPGALWASHRRRSFGQGEAQCPQHHRALARALQGATQRIKRAQLPGAPARRSPVDRASEAGIHSGSNCRFKERSRSDLVGEHGCGITTTSPERTAGGTGGAARSWLPTLLVGIERLLPAPRGNANGLPACSTAALPSSVERFRGSGQ